MPTDKVNDIRIAILMPRQGTYLRHHAPAPFQGASLDMYPVLFLRIHIILPMSLKQALVTCKFKVSHSSIYACLISSYTLHSFSSIFLLSFVLIPHRFPCEQGSHCAKSWRMTRFSLSFSFGYWQQKNVPRLSRLSYQSSFANRALIAL